MKRSIKKIFAILMALVVSLSGLSWVSLETRASDTTIKYSGVDGDLSWSIDTAGHLLVEGSGDYTDSSPAWLSYRSMIYSAKIAVDNTTNLSRYFQGCDSLQTVDLTEVDSSKVTNMSEMFAECMSLTSVKLSGLDTSNVTDMGAMFFLCSSLTNLDLSTFDTSNVTSMVNMFNSCQRLVSLDLSNFNTSQVTSMAGMFQGCPGLTSLNVSGFDTSKVRHTAMMFAWCSGLKQLDLSSWDMAQVSDELSANSMFQNCNQLIKLSTPINVNIDVNLPTNEVGNWTSRDGQIYTVLPKNTNVSMKLSCGKDKSEDLTGYTISLKGDIAVNLHMQLSDEILNDASAYMEFTYADGEILNIPVDKAETKNDSYVFTCNVQAPEVNDKFTAQIITSVCETEKYTYSVKEYADYILAHAEGNEEYTKAAPMVRAMLNYGGYSQLQFKHNTDALANDGLYTKAEDPVLTKEVTIDDSYTFTAPCEDIGLRYYGSSLLLDAETTIRHYFTITSEEDIEEIFEKYSFVLDEVTVLTPSMRGGMIYIDIKGINAAELDDMFNLVVKNTATEVTISVTYSPLSYAKYVLENAIAGTNLVNVIKAMCLYNEAANNYFE